MIINPFWITKAKAVCHRAFKTRNPPYKVGNNINTQTNANYFTHLFYLRPTVPLNDVSHILNANGVHRVDANGIIATGFFEPVKQLDIVAAITSIFASIVVDVNELNAINTLNIADILLYDINASKPDISGRRLPHIINPQSDKSFLLN
jgi:hypothetical protein